MSVRPLLGWLLALALVAGAVSLFFAFFEKKSFELPVGLRGEAARNRFLAAERMLEAMGLETRSFPSPRDLEELPPLDGTLFVPTQRHTLSEEKSLELVEWARAGGHLVVLTWTLWDEEARKPDPILDPLGVRQFMLEAPEEEAPEGEGDEDGEGVTDDDALAGASQQNGNEPEPEKPERRMLEWNVVARVAVAGREGPLEVEFDPFYTMEDADGRAVWAASDVNGTHLLQIPLGSGYLTALTDDYILTNDQVASYDHAELVYRLARLGGRAGPAWFVITEDWPDPWALLVNHAWMVVVSLCVVVMAWVWFASRRYGPLLPDDPLERRRLMEHIEASGRFHWRHKGAHALHEAARGALLEVVRARHPAWIELQPRELHERLARLSGIPRERIDDALAFRVDPQPERFARCISTLEKIRRSL